MASSSSSTTASVDEDLSKLTSSSLSISLTKEITQCGGPDSNIVFPKQLHGVGLYNNTLTDDVSMSTLPMPSAQKEEGVPGFPDFPSFWCGEEGWAVWKKTDVRKEHASKKTNEEATATDAAACKAPVRLRRQAVNTAGIIKHKRRNGKQSWKQPKAKVQQRTTKKTERRRKVLQKLKHKRQMVALRRGLSSLSCS
jgi:hypothetical protein